jgi:hypothetical protein
MGGIIRQTVWIYLVRAAYLRKCRILETYHTAIRGSHEPGYVIPLLACGGTIKYIPLPLYHFNGSGDGFSESNNMSHAQHYYDTYIELCDIATDALPTDIASPTQRHFLKTVARLSASLRLYRIAVNVKAPPEVIESYALTLLNDVNTAFAINPPITREYLTGKEQRLTGAIGSCILTYLSADDAAMFPGLDAKKLYGTR